MMCRDGCIFYVNSNCGVRRIFQRYALRRSLFYNANDIYLSRHLDMYPEILNYLQFIKEPRE